jgi:hypothetical protein
MDTKPIRDAILYRAEKIIKEMNFKPPYGRFFIAGGALTSSITDIDIFPAKDATKYGCHGSGELFCIPTVLSKTPNAITYDCKPWAVQVCNYVYASLKELVDSFDFAHIQVGAECATESILVGDTLTYPTTVKDVYFTDAFVQSNAIGTSWFCGSKYPLSSLIRAGKYMKRGQLSRSSHIRAVIDIVAALAKRGFNGYDDFKDQLDAVDLGLLPSELSEVERASLLELFEALNKGKRE